MFLFLIFCHRTSTFIENASAYSPFRCFPVPRDRKSTRLNSSHLVISYAVFCLKKKTKCVLVDGVVAAMSHQHVIDRSVLDVDRDPPPVLTILLQESRRRIALHLADVVGLVVVC